MDDSEKIACATRFMPGFIELLIILRVINAWCDGNTFSFTWNFYNPLFLLMMPIVFCLIIMVVVMEGVPFVWDNWDMFGFSLSDYWKEHQHDRVFIKPHML